MDARAMPGETAARAAVKATHAAVKASHAAVRAAAETTPRMAAHPAAPLRLGARRREDQRGRK